MEKLSMTREELSAILGLAVVTIRRLEYEDPRRLPPFAKVTPGKAIYLRDSVVEWLRSREGVGGRAPRIAASAAANPKQRGRPGRPRNAAAGGAVE